MTRTSFDLARGPYLTDLLDQPRAMAATVDALRPDPALAEVREGLRSGRFRRIVLTGMGGSYAILEPVRIALVRAGFDCSPVETSELLYSMPQLLAADTVLVVVSQSGASVETVRLLDRNAHSFVVGVTNTIGSPLDRRAAAVVRTTAGEETAVSCKTAVTAMAALHWAGEHLRGGDLEEARRDLEALAPAMSGYLDGWQDHVNELARRLEGIDHVFIAGRGRSMAGATLGGMIQKEAAHVHGEGMGCAALRHGPLEMLGPGVFVLVFDGDPEVNSVNRGLVRDAAAAGAGAALCGIEGEGPFRLPPVPLGVRPVMEQLPPQMMTLALALLRGRRPGHFEKITKVTSVE